ncbi:MAG: histone deacetylase [Phycisphaerales bacterium]|nr:histone deacetylase [Phycisphaerales bacterium]
MTRTFYYWDAVSLEHDTGAHVECIERSERLRPEKMRKLVPELDARPIEVHNARDWILKLHLPDYHDFVEKTCENGGGLLDHGDTVTSPRSYDAALASVNAALTAADAVMTGEADHAVSVLRPPGHHALPDCAMGFCLFGNVAILARYLQERHGLSKIAIVDWDVHHGNGTQHFFYSDPDVFFVSLHQYPLWPGTGRSHERGEGPGEGATLNLPIAPFTTETDFLSKFETVVLPAVTDFRPEFLIVSAGYDAHRDDPLAQLQLTEDGFIKMTQWLKGVAGDVCDGRLISCLEGGYNLDALQNSVAAHTRTLMTS